MRVVSRGVRAVLRCLDAWVMLGSGGRSGCRRRVSSALMWLRMQCLCRVVECLLLVPQKDLLRVREGVHWEAEVSVSVVELMVIVPMLLLWLPWWVVVPLLVSFLLLKHVSSRVKEKE